jgi:purine-cytosine permease-like protein
MGDWIRHIALRAQAKSGFSPQLVVWFLIAAVSLVLALGFLCAAGFVWLVSRTDAITASLIFGGAFLLIAIVAAVVGWMARLRNMERARRELAERSQAGWFDPKFLTIGLQVGRVLGWRRVVTLAAAGLLAAGLAKEWLGSGDRKREDPHND